MERLLGLAGFALGAAFVIVVLIVGAGLAFWIARSRAGRAPERRLLRLCRGDASLAKRLIDYEMQRAPGISRAQAARRAVEAYLRDNR